MNAFLQKAVTVIVNPMIQVVFVVALILFVYGIFEFVRGADAPQARTTGQQHMMYGLIGLTIMISVFTIIRLLLNSLGADSPEILN